MLDHVDVDDTELPSIGIAPPGTSWDEIFDHVRISRNPLLVGPGDDGQYAGVWWTEPEILVERDLGEDPDEAIEDFRGILRDAGQM